MAVFETTAFNESEEFENDDALDQMLEACDTMLDAVEESGGARKHYIKNLNIEADKNEKEIAKLEKQKNPNGSIAYQMRNEQIDSKIKAIKDKNYAINDRRHNFTAGGSNHNDYEDGSTKKGYFYDFDKRNEEQGKATRWKHMVTAKSGHNDPNETIKQGMENRIAKKKAIKETCLHILSIIDEM